MRLNLKAISPASLAILIASPVMLYLHLRSYLLAFTYDECWTYLGYATQSVTDIMCNTYPAANNHILHSLAMKVMDELFGMHEYTLRLPVVLAFIPFAMYVFWVSRRMLKNYWWVGFIAVLYQPYILDYFATARGYGLALTFMIGAIFHLDRALCKKKGTNTWLAMILVALAAYANFTYSLVAVAVALALLFSALSTGKWKRFIVPVVVISTLFVLLVWKPIHRLVEAKELYYGGSEGFYTDSLVTLANRAGYDRFSGESFAVVFALILAFSAIWAIVNWGRGTWRQAGFWISWVLLATSVGTVLQHYLLGSPYLIDRTALFLFPLLVLTGCGLIFSYEFTPGKLGLGRLIALLAGMNLALNLNLTHQLDFKEHADTRAAVADIMEASDDLPPFHLGKSKYMNATLMFYKRKLSADMILPVDLSYCDDTGPASFYYLFAKDTTCVSDKEVTLMKHYPVSDTYLYRQE